jgi:hypothetical protein
MPVLYGVLNLYGNYLRKLSKQGKELDGIASGLAGEVSDTGLSIFQIMEYQLIHNFNSHSLLQMFEQCVPLLPKSASVYTINLPLIR